MFNSVFILNGNSSKLCILAYYHMNILISSRKFDRTIIEAFCLLIFSPGIFHQFVWMRKSSYNLNRNCSKHCMHAFITMWRFTCCYSSLVRSCFHFWPGIFHQKEIGGGVAGKDFWFYTSTHDFVVVFWYGVVVVHL